MSSPEQMIRFETSSELNENAFPAYFLHIFLVFFSRKYKSSHLTATFFSSSLSSSFAFSTLQTFTFTHFLSAPPRQLVGASLPHLSTLSSPSPFSARGPGVALKQKVFMPQHKMSPKTTNLLFTKVLSS